MVLIMPIFGTIWYISFIQLGANIQIIDAGTAHSSGTILDEFNEQY